MNVIRPITVGDGGSFSRASTKTCIGPDGLLMTVPVDVPAWQYDPLNLSAAPVVLLEGAATNLLTNSRLASLTSWSPEFTSLTPNATTALDGTPTAAKLAESPVSNIHDIYQALAPNPSTTGVPITLSAMLKAGERYKAYLSYSSGGTTDGGRAIFDLSAGRVVGVTDGAPASGATATITPQTGGWYLCSVTLTPTTLTTHYYIIGVCDNSGSITYVGDGVSGVYVDFSQLEVGTTATSRITTTSSPVTRAADIITGTGLIWCNAPEAAPAAYAGGTTYAFGAQVSIAGAAGMVTVYQSLQAANTGHAPASSPTWWKLVGTTYQTYSGVATYALGDMVIDPIVHQTYQSVWPTVHSGVPLSDSTHWFNGGATSRWSTNKWAAFDDVVGTAVTMPGQVLMLIMPGAIDSMGLLNMGASSATIGMIDTASMTNVFTRTTNLADDAAITDYDQYFFEDVTTVSDLYTDGLPPYYSGVMSIALTGAGDVSLGVAKLGNTFDLGGAQYGVRVGFISYTKKVTDDDGSTSVKKGAISKRMTVTTMIDNARLDKTQRVMGDLDGVPTVIVGAGNLYTSLIQFCFVKEFDTEIAYPTNSLCSFQTEGLI